MADPIEHPTLTADRRRLARRLRGVADRAYAHAYAETSTLATMGAWLDLARVCQAWAARLEHGRLEDGPLDGGPLDGGPLDGGPLDGGPLDGGGSRG
jgi:hypothetical protein